jgi:hypothetical protein
MRPFGHATGVQATLINVLGRVHMQDREHGARVTLFAAMGDVAGGSIVQPGGLAHLRGVSEVGRASCTAYDEALAGDLWALSARLTGVESGGA